ncbi:lipid droplet-associated protein [Gordonia sp. HY285]|uniref:lipid droplet-associated protein n=1 Tax=Gordonia liuliyuniae TaxID=2911517 RepID=UPI001F43F5B3|nr:lipid droplet-associated protein [Gordonia liuliyuniae]MCF8611639.1 lipid droplet-associated protein [Gordonia liuliyuniae]
MNRPPYPARVVAGLLATTVEETRKLPTRVVTLPMSAVSSALQAGMRLQQNIAELAIKGDDVLAPIFDKAEEQPAWATFDEDDDDTLPPAPAKPAAAKAMAVTPEAAEPVAAKPAAEPVQTEPVPTESVQTESAAEPGAGRFALYSSSTADVAPGATEAAPAASSSATGPQIVVDLDYDTLTLAQVRAKVRSLSLADLQALAEYERANRNRSPFVTMIDNRVAAEQKKADSAQ